MQTGICCVEHHLIQQALDKDPEPARVPAFHFIKAYICSQAIAR